MSIAFEVFDDVDQSIPIPQFVSGKLQAKAHRDKQNSRPRCVKVDVKELARPLQLKQLYRVQTVLPNQVFSDQPIEGRTSCFSGIRWLAGAPLNRERERRSRQEVMGAMLYFDANFF